MPDLASVRFRPDTTVVWIMDYTYNIFVTFTFEHDRCRNGIAHDSLTDYTATQSGETAAELSRCHSTLNSKRVVVYCNNISMINVNNMRNVQRNIKVANESQRSRGL